MQSKLPKPYRNPTSPPHLQGTKVGLRSMEMLKVRAAFEEKLKKKGVGASEGLRKLSRHVNAPVKKRKIASGDYDLPQRDRDSDLEAYKKVKLERAAKIDTKAGIYARPSTISSLPEPVVDADGKRRISRQIEKNRGLTRSRNKNKKNSRVNNRDKYYKFQIRRKGQVRGPKTADGSYGGEKSGINAWVSRSVKF